MVTRETAAFALGAILTTLLAASAPLQAEPRNLELRPNVSEVGGTFAGRTDLLVIPPFSPALVAVELDGAHVATLANSPYRVEIDLGPLPVQRTIAVTAKQPGGEIVTWTTTINRGYEPLSIRIRRHGDGTVEARITAPEDDPVVEVAFFHGSHPLGKRTAPPWKVEGPPMHTGLLHASAVTRSGEEVSHGITPNAEVHLENYVWQRVPIEVAVVDGSGKLKTGLDASRFRITDNGEPARIVSFGPARGEPISVSILVDASASMAQHISKVSAAAAAFVNSVVRDGDRVAVYSIHQVPRREVGLTSDRAAAQKAFADIYAQGETALWDAIRFALRELETTPGRKAIVLLSDGEDTDSITGWDEIVREAEASGLPIYAIAFGSAGQGQRHADRLGYLSGQTGGFVVSATTDDLSLAYQRIEEDIRARYAIQYEVFGPAAPSRWRPVSVSVDSPDWTARAIRGYFSK